MKSKFEFCIKSLGFLTVFACFLCPVLAQNEENPRIKNFGWSLKENPKKPEDKNEVKKEDTNKENPTTDDDVIRVETNMVVSDILVFDKNGVSVKGLKKEDFVIFEDGNSQQIENFSLGDGNIPRSIVLIIDYSGSQIPYIKTSIEAAKVLVDKLKPQDKMALVTDDVELLVDFTQDKDLLKEKLEFLKKKALDGKVGKSEQYSSLYAVLNEIFDKTDARPIVIFQTDGDEYVGLKGGKFGARANQNLPLPRVLQEFKERNFSFEEVLTASEKARASVYTIYPGLQFIGLAEDEQLLRAKKDFINSTEISVQRGVMSSRNLNTEMGEKFYRNYAKAMNDRQLLLAGLAKYTGGWADFLEEPEQANDVYNRILSGINNRYVIGYYPTNEAKDGKRRVVKIEVREHPEYTIWGRKTYFAPLAEK